MKHILTRFITVTVLIVVQIFLLTAKAQDAIFVYRNDGQFNAFFNNEIDSIVCSKIDIDSITHEDFVVQEFHTIDSIYRIPITSIDSVGFQKPQIALHKNVIRMEEGLNKDLTKRLGFNLYFNASTSYKTQIKKGNILLDFTEGQEFAGRIINRKDSADCIIAICDTIRSVDEIFDKLVGIEIIGEGPVRSRSYEETIYPIEVPISFSPKFGDEKNLSFEAEGQFNGEINGKVYYNKDVDCYHVIIDHCWQPSFDIKVSLKGDFKENSKQPLFHKPIIFPLQCPIFAYIIDVRPFISSTLNVDLDASFTGVSFNYLTSFTLREKKVENFRHVPKREDTTMFTPEIDAKTSLSGNIHAGILVRNYLGLAKWIGFQAGGFVDVYIGPEFGGELTLLDFSTSSKEDIYRTLQEGRIYISPLAAKAECYAGIFLAGEEPEATSSSINIDLKAKPIERHFFPEFSSIELTKNIKGKSANFKSTITRNLVFPLSLGFGLYDKEGNLIKSNYAEQTYWNEEDDFTLDKTFTDLLRNKEYLIHPLVKFLEHDIAALPSEKFKIECEARTGEVDNIELSSATCMGEIDLPDEYNTLSYGICYSSSTQNPEINNSLFKEGSNESFSVELTDLVSDTKYFYRAYLAIDGEYTYGDVLFFKTKKEVSEVVDLGLSVNWRGWNVGASQPEEDGYYFAWGETSQKDNYTWDTYFENPYNKNGEWIGSATTTDISNTDKDAATVLLGNKWRIPTKEEMQELMDKCSWKWTEYNGVFGYLIESKVSGYEGNFIFLPAAGNFDKNEIKNKGSYGGYWSSTPLNSESKSAAYNLYFYGSTIHSTQNSNRYSGRSIRPVTSK
ncbi:MAG: hypothetical protein J6R79_00155 [Bacteroidaceae bacterium]|nr:hypothetical protein [Bacteroidaceae bacterium]